MTTSKNNNLHKAKAAKDDEFYTRYETIDEEINHYYEYDKNVFRDKVILCPCDDSERSEFVNYFRDNLDTFGIKKLIFTSYTSHLNNKNTSNDVISLLSNINNSDNKQDTRGKLLILERNKEVYKDYLKGNGDFRSSEIKSYLKEADIVITNPPFSLFREFIKWIMDAKKEFIILGSLNAVKYKDVFPYIKNNEVWLGYTNGSIEYVRPSGKKQKLGNTCWFTNIQHGKRYEIFKGLTLKELKSTNIRSPFAFMKYDNYDAIEIPECRYIPNDYNEPMGVPISFLNIYNPNQFELIGLDRYTNGNKYPNKCFFINGKEMYSRLIIKKSL